MEQLIKQFMKDYKELAGERDYSQDAYGNISKELDESLELNLVLSKENNELTEQLQRCLGRVSGKDKS